MNNVIMTISLLSQPKANFRLIVSYAKAKEFIISCMDKNNARTHLNIEGNSVRNNKIQVEYVFKKENIAVIYTEDLVDLLT